MEHTKTPLISKDGVIETIEGIYIGETATHQLADDIVLAVNSHDQLIADKKELVEALRSVCDEAGFWVSMGVNFNQEKIDVASRLISKHSVKTEG